MIIDQFLSGFHYGDAIGNSVLRFHKFLIEKGIKSRIIAATIDEVVSEHCTPFSDFQEERDSIKIYHYAISSPLNDYFLQNRGKSILIYHNITPSEYFKGFSDELVNLTEKGRKELRLFSNNFDLVIADSEFNANELREIGFSNIRTFPIMISRKEYESNYSKSYMEVFNDGKKNVLFVGRVTPNKKIEDLMKFVSVYKNIISEDIRMIIAGNLKSVPFYFSSLLNLKKNLGLDISNFFFTGHIPFPELMSVYRSADLFLSMSEHEGFCLPLIESSFFKIPVIAYKAGAIEETLRGSGILLSNKSMKKIVMLTDRVLSDERISNKLKNSAGLRADLYEKESDPEILLKLILEKFDD